MGWLKRTAAIAQLVLVIGTPMATAQPSRVTLKADSGRANVVMSAGQELELQLSANPTTGYTWRFDPGEQTHLRFKSRHYQPFATSPRPQPGAGGTEYFVFEAVSVGTEHLQFAYRKGDAGQPARRTFDLNVAVGP